MAKNNEQAKAWARDMLSRIKTYDEWIEGLPDPDIFEGILGLTKREFHEKMKASIEDIARNGVKTEARAAGWDLR